MEQKVQQLSIVMPCLNEQEAIPVVVPRVLDTLRALKKENRISHFELIVVDDQSTDASLEILSKISDLKVLRTAGQRGYGNALKCGFARASGDWIGFLDVDNSYRPEDLVLFIDEIDRGKSDFIMGSRSLSEAGMSPVRGLGNWVYRVSTASIFQSSLTDVCSGYRIFHRRHLQETLKIRESGLNFSIQLTLKMLATGVGIAQIPIRYDRRVGDSKLSVFKDGLAFARVLLSHRLGTKHVSQHR